MSDRFRYEPQTTFTKLVMRFKHPRQWRSKITPCVFDNESGTRLQLACDEEALIRRLNVRMPGEKKEWRVCTRWLHWYPRGPPQCTAHR